MDAFARQSGLGLLRTQSGGALLLQGAPGAPPASPPAADWARATGSTWTYQNSATVNKPTGMNVGDSLVFFCVIYDQPTVTATLSVTPTDTIPVVRNTTSEVIALFAWTRIIDGSEGATFAATSSIAGPYMGLVCIPVTDAHASAPLDTSSPSSGRDSAQNLPAITTSVANELLIAAKAGYNHAVSADPANWTPRADADTVNSFYDRTVTSAGAVASEALTAAGHDGYCSVVLALKPV